MKLFMILPFLGLLLLGYVGVALLGTGDMDALLGSEALRFGGFPALEGEAELVLTNGDLFMMLGLVLLGLELMKSASTGGGSLVNHALSTLFLVGAVALFLLVPGFATTRFLMLTVMILIDVLVGFTLTALSARRDVTLEN